MQTGIPAPIALHIQAARREAISLSGARNRLRLSEGGTSAPIASSFSVGSNMQRRLEDWIAVSD